MEGSASMGGGDVPNKVKKLFEQLHSWNEESQMQFAKILESHSADINQGVDDFVSEYNAMKAQLAVVSKERDELLKSIKGKEIPITAEKETQTHEHLDLQKVAGDTYITHGGKDKAEERPTTNAEKPIEEYSLKSAKTVLSGIDNQGASLWIPRHKRKQPNPVRVGLAKDTLSISKVDDTVHVKDEDIIEHTASYNCPSCDYVSHKVEDLDIHLQNIHGKIEPNENITSKLEEVRDRIPECGTERALQQSIAKVITGYGVNSEICCWWSQMENLEKKKISTRQLRHKEFQCEKCKDVPAPKIMPLKPSFKPGYNACKVEGCDYVATSNISTLKRHMWHRHKIADKTFKCDQCPHESLTKNQLMKHVEIRHDKIKSHVCDICGFAAFYLARLKSHKVLVHKEGDMFKCDKCPYEAPSKGYLQNHVKNKHDDTHNYICEDCGYRAKEISRLRNHRITVHKIGEKQHKCDQCSWAFYMKTDLNHHIKAVHKKIKPHKCDECDYTATEKGNMRSHISAVHRKIRNFVCDECGFAASGKSNLKTHIKAVHKKIKDNACQLCDYKTSLRCNLRTHIKLVHEKKSDNKDGKTRRSSRNAYKDNKEQDKESVQEDGSKQDGELESNLKDGTKEKEQMEAN